MEAVVDLPVFLVQSNKTERGSNAEGPAVAEPIDEFPNSFWNQLSAVSLSSSFKFLTLQSQQDRYQATPTPAMTTPLPIRYDIYRPALSYHFDITAHDSKQNLFYCNVVRFTKSSTPDLVLHAGQDKRAPSIALAHILQFSQSFKIGFGSTADMDAVEWEDFTRSNIKGSEHRWGMTLQRTSDSPSPSRSNDRLSLVWKRTTTVTAEGGSEPVTGPRGHRGHRGWKLVEESRPEDVWAIFTFDRVFGRRGILQINVNYGEKFNTGVLISILTLYERSEAAVE
ncbi:C6 zinc finger domain protein [Pochonia chlamydosporia 170]|uniref:C6 zinc finger domain protein n=1 Tax=Pochonia chlamydosporia 170 TaxID=1380566 RepID=A0A219AQE6_METCM|nr:C6 zinc finger domain protein [Pochonia chlamydosporia 170]OWT43008.1 C6 zinc finger domain protein [Pochonia chlamydosporia 170]